MIVNFEIDEEVLTKAVVESLEESCKSEICESVAENFDASDIAEYISTYDVARELDMDDLFANVEMNYEELSGLIIHADNFKDDVAALMWQQFSEEFGASMKCVREEIAMINAALDARAIPFWKRWIGYANKKKVASS
jgi:enoyl-[acyl-carrier-protein] reductase (NADH)